MHISNTCRPSWSGLNSYKDMAVIARTAYNTRELEESLAARGIPYTVEGGSSFFSRPEVQAPLALLALCANPQVTTVVIVWTDSLNFRCCVCRPRSLCRNAPFDPPHARLFEPALAPDEAALPVAAAAREDHTICCIGFGSYLVIPVSLTVLSAAGVSCWLTFCRMMQRFDNSFRSDRERACLSGRPRRRCEGSGS